MPRCLGPADSCNHTSPHAAVAVVHPMLATLVQAVHLAGQARFYCFGTVGCFEDGFDITCDLY